MSKNIKTTSKIEKLIKEKLHSLDDGIQMARGGSYLEGCPLFVVYYDRENKGCIMIDEYNLSDIHDYTDDILSEFVWNHKERFVRVPHEIASHDYDLMVDFANMKKNAKLINALQDFRPMATFNYLVGKLDLDKDWFEFRNNAYDEQFKEWAEEHDIAL